MADNQSDNTFDSEKKWQNVQSSRSKPKKWQESEGVQQDRAESLSAGATSGESVMDNLKNLWGDLKKGMKK